jgi:hypothetical protein
MFSSSYAELGPLNNTTSNNIPQSLDELYSNQENSDTKYINLLKDAFIDILNDDSFTAECDTPDPEIKTKIDEIFKQINDVLGNFQGVQDDLLSINEEYSKEIAQIKKQIAKVDSMIDFIKKISYEDIDTSDIQPIIDSMKQLSEKILKNKQITELKNKYTEKKREMNIHIQFIKELNKYNSSCMCPICFKSQVTHYANPCGHTACQSCFDKNRKQITDINGMSQSSTSLQCLFCRKNVNHIHPLYFL